MSETNNKVLQKLGLIFYTLPPPLCHIKHCLARQMDQAQHPLCSYFPNPHPSNTTKASSKLIQVITIHLHKKQHFNDEGVTWITKEMKWERKFKKIIITKIRTTNLIYATWKPLLGYNHMYNYLICTLQTFGKRDVFEGTSSFYRWVERVTGSWTNTVMNLTSFWTQRVFKQVHYCQEDTFCQTRVKSLKQLS